ncbi:MAG: hypothetical protein PHN45_00045 [Methylococcales bacterium]|nr:hypothetical protein [Methylococcales bacterium]
MDSIPVYQIKMHGMFVRLRMSQDQAVVVTVGVKDVWHTADLLKRKVDILVFRMSTTTIIGASSEKDELCQHMYMNVVSVITGNTQKMRLPVTAAGVKFMRHILQSSFCLYMDKTKCVEAGELSRCMDLFDLHAENVLRALTSAMVDTHIGMHVMHPNERRGKYTMSNSEGGRFAWTCGLVVRNEEIDMMVKRFVEKTN